MSVDVRESDVPPYWAEELTSVFQAEVAANGRWARSNEEVGVVGVVGVTGVTGVGSGVLTTGAVSAGAVTEGACVGVATTVAVSIGVLVEPAAAVVDFLTV